MQNRSRKSEGPDRRSLMLGAAGLLAAPAAVSAQSREFAVLDKLPHRRVMSYFDGGPADFSFEAFPFVRADAPRGGIMSMAVYGTYNSFNAFILQGDAAFGMEFLFDSLLKWNLDEPASLYPLVARSFQITEDRRYLRFHLDPNAHFHDGSRVEAADVVFSIEVLRRYGHPAIRMQLNAIDHIAAEGDNAVVVRFEKGATRESALSVARQPVFSNKHYRENAFANASLIAPLGSGPYRIERYETGRYVVLQRVEDYWAQNLPTCRGMDNFDRLRFEYFRDRTSAFAAFKIGALNVHEDLTAANWVNGYSFPAAEDKRVLRSAIPDSNISGVQGWFFNTRRDEFSDPRVREAIACAFDFTWTNRNLFYDQYRRTQSFFENSELAAQGPADQAETALLKSLRAPVRADIYGDPWSAPDGDGSGRDRDLLKRATDLLLAAGYKRDGDYMIGEDGAPLAFEILDSSNALERATMPFIRSLALVGIDARLRIVDAAQYRRRLQQFDFDVTPQRLELSNIPAGEVESLYGSKAAGVAGSRNIIGVSDPLVDELIGRIKAARTRAEFVPACRCLDRALRAGRYWVPHWYKAARWMAHWDVFGRPERPPRFAPAVLATWWWDEEKAKRTLPDGG